MAEILSPYTLSQVVIHAKQELSIRLQRPLDAKLQRAKDEFQFEEAKLDDDDDFVAKAGILKETPDVKIRAVTLYPSRNRLSADIIGGDTRRAISVLTSLLSILYGLTEDDLSSGTVYIEYKTVTKAQMSTNLDGIFSNKMQEIIQKWRRFDTGAIVARLGDLLVESAHGAVTISDDYFNRFFKGQADIFVLPSEIEFFVYLPTKYYRMTKYQVSIQVQSFEDYTDRLFFFSTELPYDDHVALIQEIEAMG